MAERWHKLFQSDIDRHGYTMSLLIIIAHRLNPGASMREIARIVGCGKSYAQEIIAKYGTDYRTPDRTLEEATTADLSGSGGQPTGHSAGQPSRARVVVGFGSGTSKATTETTTTERAGARGSFSPPDWFPLLDWQRLLSHRKAKKATATSHSLALVVKQYDLGRAKGWSVPDMVDEQITRDWRALKAEWLEAKKLRVENAPKRAEPWAFICESCGKHLQGGTQCYPACQRSANEAHT